ncbi:MAG: hypothetical protein NTW30_02075 [Candidatus Aenigmarchaeota archaeon]|nr:hypothetical protein [Candidatus Aenigmarchaeota archaeon]
MLNYTSVDGGDLGLPTNVFKTLAPLVPNMYIGGTISNVLGKFDPPSSQGLQGVVPGVTGTPGVGYKLLKFNFKVVGIGESKLDLCNTSLLDSHGKHIVHEVSDGSFNNMITSTTQPPTTAQRRSRNVFILPMDAADLIPIAVVVAVIVIVLIFVVFKFFAKKKF